MSSNLTKSNGFQMNQAGSRVEEVFKGYEQNDENAHVNKATVEELIDYMAQQNYRQGGNKEKLLQKIEDFKVKNLNAVQLEQAVGFQIEFVRSFVGYCRLLRGISEEQLATLSSEDLNVLVNLIHNDCRGNWLRKLLNPLATFILCLIPFVGWAILGETFYDSTFNCWGYLLKVKKLRKVFGPHYFPYTALMAYISRTNYTNFKVDDLAKELKELESCQTK